MTRRSVVGHGGGHTGKENLATAYTSLPAAASASPRRDARSSGRRPAPPPPQPQPAVELDAMSAFPELAALEAQFQAQLASVKGGGTGGGGGDAGHAAAGGRAEEEATSPSVERSGGAASPSTPSYQSLSQMQAQFQQRLSSARVSPKAKPQPKPRVPQSPQSPGAARAKAAAAKAAEAKAEAAAQPEAKVRFESDVCTLEGGRVRLTACAHAARRMSAAALRHREREGGCFV